MKRAVDLAERLGISYRQIHHWVAQGHVLAGNRVDNDNRILDFTATEERVLRIMAGLVKFGIKPTVAASLARQHVESRSATTIVDIDNVGHITIAG